MITMILVINPMVMILITITLFIMVTMSIIMMVLPINSLISVLPLWPKKEQIPTKSTKKQYFGPFKNNNFQRWFPVRSNLIHIKSGCGLASNWTFWSTSTVPGVRKLSKNRGCETKRVLLLNVLFSLGGNKNMHETIAGHFFHVFFLRPWKKHENHWYLRKVWGFETLMVVGAGIGVAGMWTETAQDRHAEASGMILSMFIFEVWQVAMMLASRSFWSWGHLSVELNIFEIFWIPRSHHLPPFCDRYNFARSKERPSWAQLQGLEMKYPSKIDWNFPTDPQSKLLELWET